MSKKKITKKNSNTNNDNDEELYYSKDDQSNKKSKIIKNKKVYVHNVDHKKEVDVDPRDEEEQKINNHKIYKRVPETKREEIDELWTHKSCQDGFACIFLFYVWRRWNN